MDRHPVHDRLVPQLGCGARNYGKQEWIDESIKQVLMHIKYLYDTHTGLFFHGWSFNRMDNFGGVF